MKIRKIVLFLVTNFCINASATSPLNLYYCHTDEGLQVDGLKIYSFSEEIAELSGWEFGSTYLGLYNKIEATNEAGMAIESGDYKFKFENPRRDLIAKKLEYSVNIYKKHGFNDQLIKEIAVSVSEQELGPMSDTFRYQIVDIDLPDNENQANTQLKCPMSGLHLLSMRLEYWQPQGEKLIASLLKRMSYEGIETKGFYLLDILDNLSQEKSQKHVKFDLHGVDAQLVKTFPQEVVKILREALNYAVLEIAINQEKWGGYSFEKNISRKISLIVQNLPEEEVKNLKKYFNERVQQVLLNPTESQKTRLSWFSEKIATKTNPPNK